MTNAEHENRNRIFPAVTDRKRDSSDFIADAVNAKNAEQKKTDKLRNENRAGSNSW